MSRRSQDQNDPNESNGPDADPDVDALRAACTRFLTAHGGRKPAQLLAELTEYATADTYGDGGAVTGLEQEVADLLQMPAAVFFPSGTMAQQVALRLHADRTGRRVVAWHPTSHLALHELGAVERLHGLAPRALGEAPRLFTVDDLTAVAEPLAAVLFELPQREIGGLLPEWDDLTAQIAAARDSGARTHLDGARLWEAAAGYGRTEAQICAQFDTAYVSFYKGLGGLSGCCLLGPESLMAEAREWRKRHGGTLFALWPYAAAAMAGLRLRRPRMPAYLAHARAIALALRELPDVEVIPDPPHTAMMHLRLRVAAQPFDAALRRLAAQDKTWAWTRCYPTESSSWQRVELSVGDATLQWSPAEVADLLLRLIAEAHNADEAR